MNEIATKVGIETCSCSNLLGSLIALGIVKKEIPVTENISRKTIYKIEGQMFRFWYRFVGPNINLIVVGNGELIYDQKVAQNLNAFMGFVFEQIAQEYLTNQIIQNKLPFTFSKIGRWWGNNALNKRE